MAAPFDANGRYQGGILSVANTMMQHKTALEACGLDISKFNTCKIYRTVGTDATMGIDNIKNTVLLYTSICGAIKDSKADVLYYHSSIKMALLKDLLVIRHAKRRTGIKTAIHIHYAEYDKIMTGNKLIDELILSILRNDVDQVVFLSKVTMESFIEHGVDRGKCNVIYNFTTLDVSAQPKDLIHQDHNPMRLLFVGDIGERKGFFDLADVMQSLNDIDIELHVCGAPSNSESSEKFKAYQEKLGKQIIFHGYVSGYEKEKIFKDSDILVLPSYGEGLPMVIMEALSAGCAVISTNVGAIPEIIQDDNGIIIHPGDKDALTHAIQALTDDSRMLKQMQEYNITCARDYTCERFIEKLSAVCEKG